MLTPEQSLDIDLASILEQSKGIQAAECENNAPHICVRQERFWLMVQGCCNDWTCPRCGHIRARKEYGRIVEGAKILSETEPLFFLTLTCRGADMPLATAESEYLTWTNRLLSTLRADAKKQGITWAYVQVTERQKRQHPHSHIITTFSPRDAILAEKSALLPNGQRAKHRMLYSEWLWAAVVKAGLGSQTDMSIIENPVAVAVYVSKYLFKDAMYTRFPKSWRRIRYSQSDCWNVKHEKKEGFPVMTSRDWRRVATLTEPVITRELAVIRDALDAQCLNVRFIDKSTISI